MSSITTALVSSTPKTKPTASIPSIPPPSPGTWRHPKFAEIVSRQSAATFSDRSLRIVMTNTIALAVSFAFSTLISASLRRILGLTGFGDVSSSSSSSYLLLIVRLCFLTNIVFAVRPLLPHFSPKDEVIDIPLTPSQRALLGLAPSNSSAPASAASGGFITPPRYRRASGSFSPSPLSNVQTPSTTDRRSISANYASSPLSASRQTLGFSPSPSPYHSPTRATSGSPLSYSPSASPFLQRAAARIDQKDTIQFNGRQSFGASTSSLGVSRSQSVRERGSRGGRDSEPGTPSPITNAKRTPGLNYKWMYEKGRKLPKSDSIQF